MQTKNKRLIQSIIKAENILSLFLTEDESIGISDFAKTLNQPKTTIQGIVQTLENINFLEKDERNNKYRLGPALFQLGMKYATNFDLVTIARVWMERLSFQFRQAVNVGMFVGQKVVIVLRVEPENKFMVFPQTGTVIPTHTTSIGKILIANLPETEKEKILKNYKFTPLTKNSITDRLTFDKEIKKVQKDELAFDNEENFIGLAGIAGIIKNHTNQAIAAFAITGDAKAIAEQKNEIIESVKYTSKVVSGQLGYNKNQSSR